MPNVSIAPQFTAGAIGVWSLVVIVLVALIKAWPAIKAKVNDARKIELDADGQLRTDLFKRIEDLTTQLHEERIAANERHARCERELDEVRRTLEGVVKQFLSYQLAAARAIPLTNISPEMAEAMTNLQEWVKPKEEKKK